MDKDLEMIKQGKGLTESTTLPVESSGLRKRNEDTREKSMKTLYGLLFMLKRLYY